MKKIITSVIFTSAIFFSNAASACMIAGKPWYVCAPECMIGNELACIASAN